VTVYKHSPLVLVFAQPAQDGGWKGQYLALHLVRPEVDEFRRHIEGYELVIEIVSHFNDVLTTARIAADAGESDELVKSTYVLIGKCTVMRTF